MKEKEEKEHGTKATVLENDLLEKGRQVLSDGLDKTEQLYEDTIKDATKLIRKHPLEAMAVTFGVGCLIGLLLTRRR